MYTLSLLALIVLSQRVFKLNLHDSYASDSSMTSDSLPTWVSIDNSNFKDSVIMIIT